MLFLEIVLFTLLFIILYIYVLFLFILRICPKVMPVILKKDYFPSVSLVISAYNEESVIKEKIENSLQLDYPKELLEIVIISDGSDDNTVPIIKSTNSKRIYLYHNSARRGKNICLNDVVPQLKNEIIVFSDANAMYAKNAIKKLVMHFQDLSIGCVVGKEVRCEWINEKKVIPEGLYLKYENMIKELQSRLRTVIVGNGPIFSIRRMLFSNLENDVANDFQTPIEIGGNGYDIIYEKDALSYEYSTTDYIEEFNRKKRIITRGLSGAVKLRKSLRGFRLFIFLSHKFFRWFVGYMQIFIFLLNIPLVTINSGYKYLLALQICFYIFAVIGWSLNANGNNNAYKIFNVPFYFCMVNLAGLIAVIEYFAGSKFTIWEKSKTNRNIVN